MIRPGGGYCSQVCWRKDPNTTFKLPFKPGTVSDETRAKMSRALKGRPSKRKKIKPTIICEQCRCSFTGRRNGVPFEKQRFCSRSCWDQFQRDRPERCSGYIDGQATGDIGRGPNWTKARRAALKRDGSCCQECGRSDLLRVHHRIPFADFNGNYLKANNIDNLQTLCISCHPRIEAAYRRSLIAAVSDSEPPAPSTHLTHDALPLL